MRGFSCSRITKLIVILEQEQELMLVQDKDQVHFYSKWLTNTVERSGQPEADFGWTQWTGNLTSLFPISTYETMTTSRVQTNQPFRGYIASKDQSALMRR